MISARLPRGERFPLTWIFLKSPEFVMPAHQDAADACCVETFGAIVVALVILALVFLAIALAVGLIVFVASLF